MKGALFITPYFLLSNSFYTNFLSWQLITNHKLANFLLNNSHESNSLYLALLLQEPLMAHDDGSSTLTSSLTS